MSTKIYIYSTTGIQVFVQHKLATCLRFLIADGGNVGAGEGEGPPLHFSKKDSSKTPLHCLGALLWLV